MAWYHRILNIVRTSRLNREIEREQAFHIAEKADALRREGLSEAAALRAARRAFGNPTYQREATRDADVFVWLDSVARDLRHALRGLAREPGFALVAVLSLALGIGANTAVFSLIEAVVLRPLPVPDPEELVVLGMGWDTPALAFTNPQWEQIRDRQTGMSVVAAFSERLLNTAEGGEPRRVEGLYVSGDYFRLFGVAAAAGRVLTPADDVRGCAPVAVLGHGYWQREHGGAGTVVGGTLRLEGVPFEVVGVTRPGFSGPEVGRETDVYVPLCSEAALAGERSGLDHRSRWWLRIMGRLEPGVTVAQLDARLAVLAPDVFAATVPDNFSTESKEEYRSRTLNATVASTGLSWVRERYGPALYMLMGGVGLVLLIACANVANLLLARATARERELAIRAAIGACGGRLGRQMMTESLLLAVLGAAAGLIVARLGAAALVGLIEDRGQAPALDLSLNLPVLAFTTGIAVLTVLVFGLLPAWRAARVDPQTTMSARGRAIAEGHGRLTLGKALVGGQVALSMVLLASAGLLAGSLRNLTTLDPGFTADGVLLASVDFRPAGLGQEASLGAAERLLERIRALPGVRAASTSDLTPVGGVRWNDIVVVDGFTPASDMDAWFNQVSPGYFATMETRFLAGRDFGPGDVSGTRRVAVVTESAARKFFAPAGDVANALGREFRNPIGDSLGEPHTVIGVVEDAKYSSLREETSAVVFLAASQAEGGVRSLAYEVRTEGRPGSLVPAITAAVAEVNPALSVEYETLSDQLARSVQRERMLAILSTVFAVLALALAVLGLYGIMAYAVARRRNEIGVRIALGADRARVLGIVLRDAGLVLAIGLLAGTAGAAVAGRLVTGFLYGLSPAEPTVLAGAAAVLALVALTAATLPAWKAARLDPTEALREE